MSRTLQNTSTLNLLISTLSQRRLLLFTFFMLSYTSFRCGQIFPKDAPVQCGEYACLSGARASLMFQESNEEAQSDKVRRHGYHEAYGPLLAPYLCQAKVRILEIGVQDGNSLRLWETMFPDHVIIVGVVYGKSGSVRVDAFKTKISDKIVLYHGDQSDEKFLRHLQEDLFDLKFDIIIDDGSHIPWHQIFTLERLFGDLLMEGGIYVIEDVETSYWDRKESPSIYGMYKVVGAGVGSRGSAVQKLKEIPEVLNRRFLNDAEFSILKSKVDHLVASITFSRNCVALVKKVAERWAEIDKLDSSPRTYRPSAIDPKRVVYKKYRESVDYLVTGTPA